MFGKGDSSSTYYYGSDTYKHIDDLIERGREVLIVSPYVDRYYAKRLLGSSMGRKFYLISSSMDNEALNMLRGNSSLFILAHLSVSMVLLALLLYISSPIYFLPIALAPLVVGTIKNIASKRILLKTPSRFVHAKMYISESEAITGSANLTYNGTHKNLEQISITRSKENIDVLRKQFWELWADL